MSPDRNLSSSNAATTGRNHRHVILAFVIGALLTLMQLKFRSFATPFETHSALMSIFSVAVLVYAVSLAIVDHLQSGNNPYHPVVVDKVSILFGGLAAVSLVLVIGPALGWFVLIVWMFFAFKYIYDACQELCRLYQEMSSPSDVFHHVFALNAHHNELPD